jgi:hypothetical protein
MYYGSGAKSDLQRVALFCYSRSRKEINLLICGVLYKQWVGFGGFTELHHFFFSETEQHRNDDAASAYCKVVHFISNESRIYTDFIFITYIVI